MTLLNLGAGSSVSGVALERIRRAAWATFAGFDTKAVLPDMKRL